MNEHQQSRRGRGIKVLGMKIVAIGEQAMIQR